MDQNTKIRDLPGYRSIPKIIRHYLMREYGENGTLAELCARPWFAEGRMGGIGGLAHVEKYWRWIQEDLHLQFKLVPDFSPALSMKLSDIEFSVRVSKLLLAEFGAEGTIKELTQKTYGELRRGPGFGPAAISEIEYHLAKLGLHLGTEV